MRFSCMTLRVAPGKLVPKCSYSNVAPYPARHHAETEFYDVREFEYRLIET